MVRPRVLDIERLARAVRTIPEAIGRPATTSDLVKLLRVSGPTIRKYRALAVEAGLLEAPPSLPEPPPEETAPQS